MTPLRGGVLALVLAVLIGGAYAGFSWQRARTPEAALLQAARAVQEQDRALFEEYVDTDAVLAGMHEDASALLADNIDALHARHPADWFFRHDAAFMRSYMAERRAADIAFARAALDYYFDDARVPVTKEDGNARWASDEMRAFVAGYTCTLGAVHAEGNRAETEVLVHGGASDYGRLMPEASVTMEMIRRDDGRWRLVRIRTDAERPNGFFALIDAAERYWALQGWD